MSVLHQSREPRLVTVGEIRAERPLMSRTVITTIEAENALVGAWCKRVVPFHAMMRTDGVIDDSGNASGLLTTFRIPWVTGPGEEYAWLGLMVTAEAGQSSPPSVTAAVYDGAGALIDAGVTWSTTDRTLPTSPQAGLLELYGVAVGGEKWIDTGWATAAEVAAGLRLLQLGDPGTRHEIRITTIGTRLNGGLIAAANRGVLPSPS